MMPAAKMCERQKIEAAFRLHAFHALYYRTLRDETDKAVRFIKAILLSARPIPEGRRPIIEQWYRSRGAPERERATQTPTGDRMNSPALIFSFLLALAIVVIGCGSTPPPPGTQPTSQPVDPNAVFLAKVAKVRTFIETAFPPGPKRDAWLARLDLVMTADALAVLAVELGVDLAK